MKKFLIFISFVLSVATTGLFAEAVTAPVATESAPAQDAPAKTGKHGKHKKQAKKTHKRHHHKKTDAAPSAAPAPAQQ